MTTIAFRDGILAADTQGNWRDTPTHVSKIYKVHDHGSDAVYLDGSGVLWRIREIVKQCEAIADDGNFVHKHRQQGLWKAIAHKFYDKHHDAKPDETPSCLLIQAGTGNVLWLDGPRFSAVTFNRGYVALGSGADYAMGAMAAGADAVQAVQIAIDHDVHTGGVVESVNCKGGAIGAEVVR